MKASGGVQTNFPGILKLGTTKPTGKLRKVALLPLKNYPVSIERRLAGIQTWPGHFGEDWNLFLSSGFKLRTLQP